MMTTAAALDDVFRTIDLVTIIVGKIRIVETGDLGWTPANLHQVFRFLLVARTCAKAVKEASREVAHSLRKTLNRAGATGLLRRGGAARPARLWRPVHGGSGCVHSMHHRRRPLDCLSSTHHALARSNPRLALLRY